MKIPPLSIPSSKGSSPAAKTVSKAPAAPVKSGFSFGGKPASQPAAAPKTASKKDSKSNMTWGGRPDPTPELYVEEKPGFFSAGWRFGKK